MADPQHCSATALRLWNAAASSYAALPPRCKPSPTEWTILAAIVAETGDGEMVVSLGTGTRCTGVRLTDAYS
jgi:hypothetical protein